MDDKLHLLIADVKDIKSDVKELLKQSAVHNQILSEHERRSTQLEERFTPVEHTYVFGAKAAVVLGLIATLLGLWQAIAAIRGG